VVVAVSAGNANGIRQGCTAFSLSPAEWRYFYELRAASEFNILYFYFLHCF